VANTPRGENGDYPQIIGVPPDHIYLKRGDSTKWLRLDLKTLLWEQLSPLPSAYDSPGSLLAYDSTRKYIFHLRGGLSREIHLYETARDAWRTLPPLLEIVGDGAFILYGESEKPNSLYISLGSAGTSLYEYNIITLTYKKLRNLPITPTDYSTAIKIGKYIYYSLFPRLGYIYRYNIDLDEWSLWGYTSFYSLTLSKVNSILIGLTQNLVERFDEAGRPQTLLTGPPWPTAPVSAFTQLGDYIYGITGWGAEGSIWRISKTNIIPQSIP